jgi:hypothetical protein
MKQKFNKFETLFEAAFSHFSNGGFREGTPIIIKPSFLKDKYFKKHYSGEPSFVKFLKELIDNEVLFFIKRVVASGARQNVKDANDNEGAGNCYLLLRTDPRKVEWPTEFNDFTVPGDFDLVEVKDYGINLPPLESVPNKYERPMGDASAKVFRMESKIDNQPTDNHLPTKNTVLKHSKGASDAVYKKVK